MASKPEERNQASTVYVVSLTHPSLVTTLTDPAPVPSMQGNLDERVTDALVWELMLQAGPVGA